MLATALSSPNAGEDLWAVAQRLLAEEVLEGEEMEQLLREGETADVSTDQLAAACSPARRPGWRAPGI